ncbi:MAG: alpha/beta fold hydrolase [Pseudomonadota bacterium]
MRDPLVFLPGLMSDSRVFEPQIAAFSPHIPVTVAPVTVGDRVEEIASRLLDTLPRRFNLAGHSMGGVVAMEILRRAPDRVSRLALMNTNSLAETPQSSGDYEPVIIKLRSGRLDEAVDMIIRPDTLAPDPARASVLGLTLSMATHLGEETIIRQIRALQRRRDYQGVLRRCQVPVLVLCGAYDRLTPVKRHELMADLIPQARLRVFQGSGHLPMLEQPEEVIDELFHWFQRATAPVSS